MLNCSRPSLAVVGSDNVVVSSIASSNNLMQNGRRDSRDNDDTNPPSGITTPEHDHDPKFDDKLR